MGRLIDPDGLVLVDGPHADPLDLDLVKLQRRFPSSTALDELFTLWIRAATQAFEAQTGRQCITAIWDYYVDAFPSGRVLKLPRPPLQRVISVDYLATDDTTWTTWADATTSPATLSYDVLAPAGPTAGQGSIVLHSTASWPTPLTLHEKPIRVRFVAGYGDTAAQVPDLVRYALLQLVGHYHRFGEDVQAGTLARLPMGAEQVIRDFAVWYAES